MRYIALWRGINVGKAKRLAMADLKALLGELGATDVKTLLNSGNAVFDSRKKIGADKIRAAVRERLGVDAAVILKTASEWGTIAATHGMAEADDPSRLLVAITKDAASLRAVADIAADSGERFIVTADAAYLWCGNGILESKAAARLLKRLGEAGTTRNWATVSKLNAQVQT
jgi:uncharacterized protein (DUF1697 family)